MRNQQEAGKTGFRYKSRMNAFYEGLPGAPYGNLRNERGSGRRPAAKITIAIADDCAIQHKIWGLLIGSHTALELVCQAYNGQELIHQIETSALLPDICILDLEMPVMNGVCTAKRLSQRFPSIKIFGYSSCEDDGLKKEMLKNNVITVFSKTENRVLLHTISQLGNTATVTGASCNS
ncbi:response regulator transcription factor [Niabella sp.]|uniref:response regulator n=1 Tax=Niabella sp. TaxID=1962976 RepID=UPI0026131F07|nr:response regulator transcription factor [Niabella sp.]